MRCHPPLQSRLHSGSGRTSSYFKNSIIINGKYQHSKKKKNKNKKPKITDTLNASVEAMKRAMKSASD